MSKTKAGGKTAQQSTRAGKRLGLKATGGETVKTGMILARQRGTKYHPGNGVGIGRDHTLFAKQDGVVGFKVKHSKKYITVS